MERGRRLGRGVWAWYLTAGAVLAVSRVALLVWVNYRAGSQAGFHSYLRWEWYAQSGLFPEAWLSTYGGLREYYLAWGSLLTLGSFVLATPILLVGWLMRRRR